MRCLPGIFHAFENLQPLIDLQEQLQKSSGKAKRPDVAVIAVDEALRAKVQAIAAAGMEKVFNTFDKLERGHAYDQLKQEVVAALDPEKARGNEVGGLLSAYKKSFMRDKIVNSQIRIGGRKFDQVREIACETEYLPRTHGSALFTRGETQALVSTTLGSERDKQRVETLHGEITNRFMLHYNFPPYCVGEVRRLSGPSRRDIGHGNLATRGLEAGSSG